MRLYFIRTMLRHNLVFSAGLSAFLAFGEAFLYRLSAEAALRSFASRLQFCLASVGLGFAFLVFHRFQGHTRPLYWNLGISSRQLLVLGVASGLAASLIVALGLGLGMALWGGGARG